MQSSLLDRFYRYVKIDTQSQEDIEDRYPSTEKQKDLSLLLVQELKELGLKDAEMDQYGYVMATLPGNLSKEENKKVPVIGFLGHVDTSPEVSGKDVKPCMHHNYQGEDIQLSGDSSQIISVSENPELMNNIGNDIITSDGTTLLGADDKAGIAEIMTMLERLQENPDIKHGNIRIGFTPDEETGNGTAYFDVIQFGADFAYTVDGSSVGEIENETFNAASAVFKVAGINVHPGYAKNKLVNALRVIGDIILELEGDPSPETTENREGYLHPYVAEGGVGEAMLKILIRDFDKRGMDDKAQRLRTIQQNVQKKYPRASVHLDIQDSYQNMKVKLDEDPRVVDYAMEAVRRSGIEPKLHLIRGGTDGAKLCFINLLTPNIFTGGQNFHSKQEWIPVQAMEKAVETLLQLVQIWKENNV